MHEGNIQNYFSFNISFVHIKVILHILNKLFHISSSSLHATVNLLNIPSKEESVQTTRQAT